MKFDIEKKSSPNIGKYKKENIDIAYEFAKQAYKEFGSFVKAIILFGSSTRTDKKSRDIDILMIVDDVSMTISQDMVEAYRVINEKLITDVSKDLHITTLKFTNFWEYVREGDPIAINMLSSGMCLIDSGFFEPLQHLLNQGRIRPSHEAVGVYIGRAKKTLHNSRWHLTQATLDLYWGVIDAAHSALMKIGEMPPTPSKVAERLTATLVRKKLLDKKYALIMDKFYKLSKKILHGEIVRVSGKQYDIYSKEAADFVEKMKQFVESRN